MVFTLGLLDHPLALSILASIAGRMLLRVSARSFTHSLRGSGLVCADPVATAGVAGRWTWAPRTSPVRGAFQTTLSPKLVPVGWPVNKQRRGPGGLRSQARSAMQPQLQLHE